MKKATLIALATVAVAGTSFAGPAPVISSKDFKQPVAATTFFKDTEIAIDAFYSYNNAQQRDPALCRGDIHVLQPQYLNDGSGGGVGANFFFARYFGVGLSGNWWDGIRTGVSQETHNDVAASGKLTGDRNFFRDSFKKHLSQQFTADMILRCPIEFKSFGLAPYILGGGGLLTGGNNAGFADVGAGVEVRLTPHFGVFSDYRWNFVTGDNRNDVSTTRAGVRFVF